MDNLILSHQDKSVLFIQFNRIDKKNALTHDMYEQLITLFDHADKSPDIKVVALHGDSTCFTAGNDLIDFLNASQNEELAAIRFVNTLINFKKPLVAAVAGPAVGIGTTLLLHCDYVVASPMSIFKLPFTNLGLCPEAASSYLLPKLVGHVKAFELLVMGNTFSEQDALSFGIINTIVENDKLIEHLAEKAQLIANLPTSSVLMSKQLMKSSLQDTLNTVSNNELDAFKQLLQSEECKAILTALLQR